MGERESVQRRSLRRRRNDVMVLLASREGGDAALEDTLRERPMAGQAEDRGDRWARPEGGATRGGGREGTGRGTVTGGRENGHRATEGRAAVRESESPRPKAGWGEGKQQTEC